MKMTKLRLHIAFYGICVLLILSSLPTPQTMVSTTTKETDDPVQSSPYMNSQLPTQTKTPSKPQVIQSDPKDQWNRDTNTTQIGSKINDLRLEVAKGNDPGIQQYILIFKSIDQIPQDYLKQFSFQELHHLPVVFVEAPASAVDTLYHLANLQAIYLNQIQKLIPQDWNNQTVQSHTSYDRIIPFRQTTGAAKLYDLGIDGTDQVIAILDSGIDSTHPDLDDIDNNPNTNDPKVIKEKSFIDFNLDGIADETPMDYLGHGTHVAGIAAANGTIKGIAPGAKLLNAKVIANSGSGSYYSIANGIDWAINNGADVLSMSLGLNDGEFTSYVNELIDSVVKSGTPVAVAAGNAGPSKYTILSPGMANYAMTVGGSNYFNITSTFSSRGLSMMGSIGPDLIAPSQSILSTAIGNNYNAMSGTSMATPIVAAAFALLQQAYPTADMAMIRSAILNTTTDNGQSELSQGTGMLSINAAYDQLAASLQTHIFPTSRPLDIGLSMGETVTIPFDIYMGENTGSPQVTVNIPEATVGSIHQVYQSWYQIDLTFKMGLATTTGKIEVSNATNSLHNSTIRLILETAQDDLGNGTDAGETLAGALQLNLDQSYDASFQDKYDKIDLYNVSLVKGTSYKLDITHILSVRMTLSIYNPNGTSVALYSFYYSTPSISFTALDSGNYVIKFSAVIQYVPQSYSIKVSTLGTNNIKTNNLLTGGYTTNALDSDNDGKYDLLQFQFDINVPTSSHSYIVTARYSQYRADYSYGKYIIESNYFYISVDSSTSRISLNFNTSILALSNYTGKYIIDELAIYDYNYNTVIDSRYSFAETATYAPGDFDTNSINSVSVAFAKEDTTGSGHPNALVANIEINVRISGMYTIRLFFSLAGSSIYGSSNTYYYTDSWSYYLAAGNQNQIQINLPFLELSTLDNLTFDSIEIDNTIRVPFYSYFSPIFFNDIAINEMIQMTTTLVDTNSNGMDDTLYLNVLYKDFTRSFYQFAIQGLYSLNSETGIDNSYSSYSQKTDGYYNITIPIDLRVFKNRGYEGPFLLYQIGFSRYWGLVYSTQLTLNIDMSQIENGAVRVNKIFPAEFTTLNGNIGWNIPVEIISQKSGNIEVYSAFSAYVDLNGSDFYYSHSFYFTISAGTQNISLFIPGYEIYNEQYLGILLLSQLVIYQDSLQTDNFPNSAYFSAISWRMVDAFVTFGSIDFVINPIDANNNQLYEEFDVTIKYNIRNTSNFRSSLFIYSSPYYSNSTNHYSAKTGQVIDTYRIDAKRLAWEFFSSQQISYQFEIIDTENFWYREFNQVWPYNLSQLEYVKPVELLGVDNFQKHDLNSDGKYDDLSYDLHLNLDPRSHNYQISMRYSINYNLEVKPNYNLIQTEFVEHTFVISPDDTGNYTYTDHFSTIDLYMRVVGYSNYWKSSELNSMFLTLDYLSVMEYGYPGSYNIENNTEIASITDLSTLDFRYIVQIDDVTYSFADTSNDGFADQLKYTITGEFLQATKLNGNFVFRFSNEQTDQEFEVLNGNFLLDYSKGGFEYSGFVYLGTVFDTYTIPDTISLNTTMFGNDQSYGTYGIELYSSISTFSRDQLVFAVSPITDGVTTSEERITADKNGFFNLPFTMIGFVLSFVVMIILVRKKSYYRT